MNTMMEQARAATKGGWGTKPSCDAGSTVPVGSLWVDSMYVGQMDSRWISGEQCEHNARHIANWSPDIAEAALAVLVELYDAEFNSDNNTADQESVNRLLIEFCRLLAGRGE